MDVLACHAGGRVAVTGAVGGWGVLVRVLLVLVVLVLAMLVLAIVVELVVPRSVLVVPVLGELALQPVLVLYWRWL